MRASVAPVSTQAASIARSDVCQQVDILPIPGTLQHPCDRSVDISSDLRALWKPTHVAIQSQCQIRAACQVFSASFKGRKRGEVQAAVRHTWQGKRQTFGASISLSREGSKAKTATRRAGAQCTLSGAQGSSPNVRGEYAEGSGYAHRPAFREGTTDSPLQEAGTDEPLEHAMASAMKLDRRDFLCMLLLLLGCRPSAVAPEDFEGEYESPDVEAFVRAPARPDIPLAAFGGALLGTGREPEQVHVSLCGPNRMRVSWVTRQHDVPSKVHYGKVPGGYDREAVGEPLTYTYLGWRSGLIHHAVLGLEEPLEADTVYYYRCGEEGGEFSFKTPPPIGPDSPLKIHVVGDLGQTGWSVSTLEHMGQTAHDLVLYAGDLSYADRYQPRWDSWGRLIEPLASSRPWMTVAGNHEKETIWGLEPPFKAYDARWPMPHAESGSSSNLFYSFEAGCAHFLMLGSYADHSVGSEQHKWLQADLAKVDRNRTPWLIAVVHAPWYNSNKAHQGDGDAMRATMEGLLHEAKVDMMFAGHVHAYERSMPVYQGAPHRAGAMYVTIGDGGNREGLASSYIEPAPKWSVKREASFGHGQLTIHNATTARWEWHRNQDDEAVFADGLWLQSLSDPLHPANQNASEPRKTASMTL